MRFFIFLLAFIICISSKAQKIPTKPKATTSTSGLIVPGTVLLYQFHSKSGAPDFNLLLRVKKINPLELEYAFADGGTGRTGMIYIDKKDMDTAQVLVSDLKEYIVDNTISLPQGSLPLLLSKKLLNDLKKENRTTLRLAGDDPSIFEGGLDPDFTFEFSTAINRIPSSREKQYLRFDIEFKTEIEGLKSVHLESEQRQMYFWLNPEFPVVLYMDNGKYEIRLNAIF